MFDKIQDLAARRAAMNHLDRVAGPDRIVTSEQLALGFLFQGERIPLVNPQRGIFKPRQLKYLLSVRTVFPKPGARVWYDDQRLVHQQIFDSVDSVDYAFMGDDPGAADNRWLRDAMEARISVIYFVGVAPGKYLYFPTLVTEWDGRALKARISFLPLLVEASVTADPVVERRYAIRLAKQRLHQATFREAVIGAYGGRCALSGLPETMLLDAAHIISDRHEKFGQPVVPNGIPLSKIHHAAFDAHLIGIDAEYRLHVAARLLDQRDGPLLESLKLLDGKPLHLPKRQKDYPDRDRLALRFEDFLASSGP
jgi:putative restriction endonuclease